MHLRESPGWETTNGGLIHYYVHVIASILPLQHCSIEYECDWLKVGVGNLWPGCDTVWWLGVVLTSGLPSLGFVFFLRFVWRGSPRKERVGGRWKRRKWEGEGGEAEGSHWRGSWFWELRPGQGHKDSLPYYKVHPVFWREFISCYKVRPILRSVQFWLWLHPIGLYIHVHAGISVYHYHYLVECRLAS